MLAGLHARWPKASKAAGAYIDRVGYRPVNGEDIGEPCVIELPELIVGAIRFGLEAAESPSTESEVAERTAGIRDAVPGEHRAAFDELLEEAKLTYRLRDERGTYADLWAIGIMRRAILGAGQGSRPEVIDEPSHLVEPTTQSCGRFLRSGRGLSSEELAGRARYRCTDMAGGHRRRAGRAAAARVAPCRGGAARTGARSGRAGDLHGASAPD